MPGSLAGLLIAVFVLLPGYVHYSLRRRLFPTRQLSRTVEAAGFIVVAAVTNTTVLVLYGLARLLPPIGEHSLDLSRLMREPAAYILLDDSRLLYVAAWLIGLVLCTSSLSAAFALELGPLKHVSRVLTPTLTETSGWYQVFVAGVPKDSSVSFVICELHDGSYISGDLAWFNTDPEEGADRDIVLATPFLIRYPDGNTFQSPADGYLPRVLVSARDIKRIYVSYIADQQ